MLTIVNKRKMVMNRTETLKKIQIEVEEFVTYADNEQLIANHDCLTVLKKIPNNSISLILTDPPYHATQKKNIYGDTQFKKDDEYINWMEEISIEWRRILKPNGSLYCFCDSSMSARLEVMLSKRFNILSHIVWTKPNQPGFDGWKGKMNKESLRQWYGHSERIIFCEPAKDGNLHRSSFGEFLKKRRKEAGLSGNKLTELTGAYGKVNHGGAVSNWETGRNIPSREQYKKIKEAILNTGKVSFMPEYEDAIRPFIISKNVEYTDVWNFESVRPYKGKHPAEKPQDMLSHIIIASSYEGDIVLDCFAGSGSTALSAKRNKRKCISIDIDTHWTDYIEKRLNELF
ncbi:DNA methylase [Escherichia coli]|jgi:adenine-specific DNA-methyltransferase|nr:DNA methylase family protein [Escherichia coli 2845350]PIS73542.1 XRE family transcriptional regulator [Escherichia coli O55:H7 str. USDA 5905]GDS00323.1 DNA methylase [Escherichia coli]CAD5571955.1 DNA methylase [Escherichia coli]CAD5647870.1 DNA methylase [Escherichia coli]